VAFSLCVDFSDLGGLRRVRYCVAHPLTGRYVSGGKIDVRSEKEKTALRLEAIPKVLARR
tara:strand:+ start:130 stop:309 length:180 start_codon:yes stop_codon:yes gene_type:complete